MPVPAVEKDPGHSTGARPRQPLQGQRALRITPNEHPPLLRAAVKLVWAFPQQQSDAHLRRQQVQLTHSWSRPSSRSRPSFLSRSLLLPLLSSACSWGNNLSNHTYMHTCSHTHTCTIPFPAPPNSKHSTPGRACLGPVLSCFQVALKIDDIPIAQPLRRTCHEQARQLKCENRCMQDAPQGWTRFPCQYPWAWRALRQPSPKPPREIVPT